MSAPPTAPALHAEHVAAIRDFILLFIERGKLQTRTFEQLSQVGQQELLVLLVLHRQGPLIVKDIARVLRDVSLSTITRILDRLEGQDLLTRALDRIDRRSLRVSLTPTGHTTVERYHGVMEHMARTMLLPLTPAERLMLVELLTKITPSFVTELTQLSTTSTEPASQLPP